MRLRDETGPDWRDGAAYAPLLAADRSFIAWEWLRRRLDYQEAAWRVLSAEDTHCHAGGSVACGRWGLHRFEPPNRIVPAARPIWCKEVHPAVLQVHAEPSGGAEDCLNLACLRDLVSSENGRGTGEHLLLSDGFSAIRIDNFEGSLFYGPLLPRYTIRGIASAEAPLRTLTRLLALCRAGGRFPKQVREARTERFVLMLRAFDALSAGASQREIAAILLSAQARSERWRVEAPALRSRVQRLVRGARAMAEGGYLLLLRR